MLPSVERGREEQRQERSRWSSGVLPRAGIIRAGVVGEEGEGIGAGVSIYHKNYIFAGDESFKFGMYMAFVIIADQTLNRSGGEAGKKHSLASCSVEEKPGHQDRTATACSQV